MIRAVLDTHFLLWWLQTETNRMLPHQRLFLEQIEQENEGVFAVSVISLWEVAKLVGGRRLESPFPLEVWLSKIEDHPRLHVEPLSARILAASVSLSDFHRDPADQLIVATAQCLALPLVTQDERIRQWAKQSGLPVI